MIDVMMFTNFGSWSLSNNTPFWEFPYSFPLRFFGKLYLQITLYASVFATHDCYHELRMLTYHCIREQNSSHSKIWADAMFTSSSSLSSVLRSSLTHPNFKWCVWVPLSGEDRRNSRVLSLTLEHKPGTSATFRTTVRLPEQATIFSHVEKIEDISVAAQTPASAANAMIWVLIVAPNSTPTWGVFEPKMWFFCYLHCWNLQGSGRWSAGGGSLGPGGLNSYLGWVQAGRAQHLWWVLFVPSPSSVKKTKKDIFFLSKTLQLYYSPLLKHT